MANCAACHTELPAATRFCGHCGAPVAASADLDETELSPQPDGPASAGEDERFLPGALVAGRYRIVALIGKGGMGEVYRATDLKLRQPVALKFLPAALAADRVLLERFLNEVRIARQVSHPNVCRVYDVGEFEGQHYISMEYVDGEDLASLLRRIGRLPADKALDIARRLCAGLAAAHERGVLHRDLKPGNVMIDGRGQVRITDFGLAGLAGQVQGSDVRSGTPAYMAPEQLAGREVTARSDIYSLGLVLYEMFTGRRPFEAATVADLMRMQIGSSPAGPSSVVRDLDPAVERTILRCLDPDPDRRPPSALAVAAGLPGGDPVAAALAAGETPSPEMVAAAGEGTAGIGPRAAVALLATAVIGLLVCAAVGGRVELQGRIPFDNPAGALAGRAREILASVGYTARPVDTAEGGDLDYAYLEWARRNVHPLARALAAGRPAVVRYWYRSSPSYFEPRSFFAGRLLPGIVTESDPPTETAGMLKVNLDMQGRLVGLRAATPEFEDPPGEARPFDWNLLLTAAGLDAATLKPAAPQWLPRRSWDTRVAWTGAWPGGTPGAMRVEAAAFRGKPVFFEITGPWSTPGAGGDQASARERAARAILLIMFLLAVFWGGALARRNVRLGRGDRRGATRLAGFTFLVILAAWVLAASHKPDVLELELAIMAVSWALFCSALVWVWYLALEPHARRLWPQTLVSWSRLLTGGVRDSLVARDVLIAIAIATGWALLLLAGSAASERAGDLPLQANLETLLGLRTLGSVMLFQVALSVASSLLTFFGLLGLRAILRKEWLAGAAFVVLLEIPRLLGSHSVPLELVVGIATLTIDVVMMVRFGLLAYIVAAYVTNVLVNVPLTLDFSAWYVGSSMFALAVVAALAAWACRAAMAGRGVFGATDPVRTTGL
jgi:serine/threonine-protein kinase